MTDHITKTPTMADSARTVIGPPRGEQLPEHLRRYGVAETSEPSIQITEQVMRWLAERMGFVDSEASS